MSTYIIYSVGRTGSTLLSRNINTYFADDERAHVIHQSDFVHSSKLMPWHDDIVCIRSRRRDLFKTAISMAIATHTQQAYDYDTNVAPFKVDREYFSSLFPVFTEFYDNIDTGKYVDVVDIYYEDLMSDERILLKTLGISKIVDYNLCEKSPHLSEDLIINYDELKRCFERWQSSNG